MGNINLLLLTNQPETTNTIQNNISNIDDKPYSLDNIQEVSSVINRLKEGGIDVLLIDIKKTNNDGLETLHKIKSEVSKVPIIVLVERKNSDFAIKAIDSGANDYLIKDEITPNLLASSLRYALERNVLMIELEQYARELLVNEEYFRNLIASNVDSMVVVDKENIVRFVNSAAESFFCKKSKEIIGKPFKYEIDPNKIVEINITQNRNKISIAEMRVVEIEWEREPAYLASLRDITERKRAEEEKTKLIKELKDALVKIKTLSGLVPICAVCKKIRDDKGFWNQLESYIQDHSSAEFSHGICPDCQKKLYPDTIEKEEKK
ncbi:MAG: response regulator [Endomicrobiales bacterium]|nr:response regulator [Endomicrobiales bacterium]